MAERLPTDGPTTVLIAHGDAIVRESLATLLRAADDIAVVGLAGDGDTALLLARRHEPAIALVDVALPRRDGFEAADELTRTLPATGVILLGRELTPDILQRAMVAGARHFLPLPPDRQELLRAIRDVAATLAARRAMSPRSRYRHSGNGEVIAVFSLKGGTGRTTVATNLAVALRLQADVQVALVDASLPVGDVGLCLDLLPVRSILDVQEPLQDTIDDALLEHQRSGVMVLQAPHRPELGEMVTPELLRQSLRMLRERSEFVIVDTGPTLDERMLTVLETADKVLLVLSPDVASIRTARVFLDVADLLSFSPDKVLPVVTRAGMRGGVTMGDIEGTLRRPIALQIPADEESAVRAVNEGTPIVLSAPTTPVATAITAFARGLIAQAYPDLAPAVSTVPVETRSLRAFKRFARA